MFIECPFLRVTVLRNNFVTLNSEPAFHTQFVGWRVSGRYLEVSGRCLQCIRGLSAMCLEGVWKVSGRYQRGVWTASKRCLEGVRDVRVSGAKL